MEEEQESQPQQRATLPPGCWFYPSEDLLLSYYLTNKNNETKNQDEDFYSSNLIKELDLYCHDPFELPDTMCFSYDRHGMKKHWYCYTVRVLKDGTEHRRRKVKSGFWIKEGKAKDVLGQGGNSILGTRTQFVFYVGDKPRNAIRTDWMLYEYALVNHLLASLVLCRVVHKPRHKKSASRIGLNSRAEESIPTVRHIGIQHDGNVTSDGIEAELVGDEGSVNGRIEISESVNQLIRSVDGQDNRQDITSPVSDATVEGLVSPQGSRQERLSGPLGYDDLFIQEAMSPQEYYLEWKDLQ